jgi:hypothetical protein
MTAARATEVALLAPVIVPSAARTVQAAALAVYSPPSARRSRTTEAAGLVVLTSEAAVAARTTEVAALVVYKTGTPDEARSRAWAFTFDGHIFYVLDLSEEGTWVYDSTTQQWSQFDSAGIGRWNMVNGTQWGNRVVAGDLAGSYVWELVPSAVLDEEWRAIEHVVTGEIETRMREVRAVAAVRLKASVAHLHEEDAVMRLRFSDDQGETWSDYYDVTLTGSASQTVEYRSLGTFKAPGRIFELSDAAGLVRIDSADAVIPGYDDGRQAS